MSDFLSLLHSYNAIPLAALALTAFVAIAAILGFLWCRLRKAEISAALKQDMLNRGMSAEEIKTVLEAQSKNS